MRFTLIADGTSDAVLLPILVWSLKRAGVASVEPQRADLSRIPRRRTELNFVGVVLDLYPCEVLFVHRDAEAQSPELRRRQIAELLQGATVRHIPVVPIRMTEAWLLADERAIRCAAGNPNGRTDLNLPAVRRLEDLSDPKDTLHRALTLASELGRRRRARLRVDQLVHLIPNYIDNYSALSSLAAFRELQQDIDQLVRSGSTRIP